MVFSAAKNSPYLQEAREGQEPSPKRNAGTSLEKRADRNSGLASSGLGRQFPLYSGCSLSCPPILNLVILNPLFLLLLEPSMLAKNDLSSNPSFYRWGGGGPSRFCCESVGNSLGFLPWTCAPPPTSCCCSASGPKSPPGPAYLLLRSPGRSFSASHQTSEKV